MKAYQETIGDILTGERKGKRFYVPAYQRPYKWDTEDAEQLAQDIYVSHMSQNVDEYFIGSVICIKNDDGRFEIVDGQQRLITLTLLMERIGAHTDDKEICADLQSRILRVDPYKDKDPIPALEVRESEREFYLGRILRGESIPDKTEAQRVFLNNQKKLGDFLSDKGMDQEQLKKMAEYLLCNVYVVFVEVNDRASSFRLFNVLNHRGLPLNDADLLKSALLEKVAGNDVRSKQVQKQWQDIEDIAEEQGEELDNFLTLHQISEKTNRDRVKSKNFDYYDGRLRKDFNGNSLKMSEMLWSSAECYGEILGGHTGASKVTEFLAGLSKPEEWMPAFMAFLNRHDRDKFPEFALLFEKVYMQGWLTLIPKSQREAACYYAVEAINNGKSHADVMSAVRALADDQALEKALDAEEFYDGSRPRIINLVKAVLLRVDRERHDDSTVTIPDRRKITVEHILPQTMTDPYWTDRFTAEQHEQWLHKLGNLTLISGKKNSAAKNLGFDRKKDAYEQANKKPSFEITKEICTLPEWDMEALRQRHEKLKGEIMALWRVGQSLL